jgi:hypothetical protein
MEGYKILSIKPALPFQTNRFLPIIKPQEKCPGAILREECGVTVLIPLTADGPVVNTRTKEWRVES